MRPRIWPALACGAILLYLLYFAGLAGMGLAGPDEPRYAAIARHMAVSGDFVSPILWGQPWFEKPPLLYWMAAAGFLAGLGEETAPRLPVVLLSLAFLAVYGRILARHFGRDAGWSAALLLSTSAGWLSLSQIGVTDLPLAAFFSLSMLLLLDWADHGDSRQLPASAACLALAALAKGLVPLVLAAPVAWFAWRRWRDVFSIRVWGVFCAVALPWYAAVTWRFGYPFIDMFFVRHHFSRFTSDVIQHVQPFWFYVPVLLAALFPWMPAVVSLRRVQLRENRKEQFLAVLVLFGFLFFSVSRNKLPAYVLPLLPLVCALVAISLRRVENARWMLASAAALLALMPLVAAVLPVAIASGISRASIPPWSPLSALLLAAAAAIWIAEDKGQRWLALGLIAGLTGASVGYLKSKAYPALDRRASSRSLWKQIEAQKESVCIDAMHRTVRYGLNYYSGTPLPDCAIEPRPVRVRERGPLPDSR